MPIRLAVFLGNPGIEYRSTRHNAGWMIAAALPAIESVGWTSKFKGTTAQYDALSGDSRNRVVLLLPATFMNLSGESVQPAMTFYKLQPEELVIVHDEIELPFGTMEIRKGGGLGGHNGLRSISAALGTNEYWRCRIGVGRPSRPDVASYVLSRFSQDEEPLLPLYSREAASRLLAALCAPRQPSPFRPTAIIQTI
ncbi:MAG TPA: aminoacyl-tRNA hydrolase [Spirochaetia bacterium]|nr:aminoacyl-tRNA hydrolase [Spirochaetia bacterium]